MKWIESPTDSWELGAGGSERGGRLQVQRDWHVPQKITFCRPCQLPSWPLWTGRHWYQPLQSIHEQSVLMQAQRNTTDPSHILHAEYELLPSGSRYRVPHCEHNRFKNSFVPTSVKLLSNAAWGTVCNSFMVFLSLGVCNMCYVQCMCNIFVSCIWDYVQCFDSVHLMLFLYLECCSA